MSKNSGVGRVGSSGDGSKPELSGIYLHRNNNAQGFYPTINQSNLEAEEREMKRREYIQNRLMDPKCMRLFTAEEPQAHWETIAEHEPSYIFPKREPPANATADQRSKFEFGVNLGSNIAKWHLENKPVVCEYLMFLKDESLNMLKPQYAAMIRKCSRRTKCYILITNRILNRQVGKFKWIKYLIVQIQGPDYTMIKICNTMLERWFPEYKQRVEYNKQRFKFGIFTGEATVDNADLYFPYQRSGKCCTNFGDLPCDTPYGSTEHRSVLDTAWKANNRLFCEGNLIPTSPDAGKALNYVFAYHPLGPKDRFEFRQMFGIKEPVTQHEVRPEIGFPNSELCGPDHPHHPNYYHKDDDEAEEEEEKEEDASRFDPTTLVIHDPDQKAKFNAKKMRLIMNKRKEWLFSDRVLGVPYPQVLLPTASIAEHKAMQADEDRGKKKKKSKPDAVIRNIRFINEDNVYLEYCFEKEHLKRNPISPYPRSLVPGRELAEKSSVTKVVIDPIRHDFIRDRREELNQRFQLLVQPAGEFSQSVYLQSQQLEKPHKVKRRKVSATTQVTQAEALPVMKFADFKRRIQMDAQTINADPDDIIGRNRISEKNIHKIVPGWRGLLLKEANIYDEVKLRLNMNRAAKDKYGNPKAFFNHQLDPYEDIPTQEPKTRVQARVRRQVVKGMNTAETDPNKVSEFANTLIDKYKKEALTQRNTGT